MSASSLDALCAALDAALGPGRAARDIGLAPFTTFKVGGPADVLVEPASGEELARVLELADAHGAAVTLLGGGSNVLVGDLGIRGVVVRPRGGHIVEEPPGARADASVTINGLVRWTIGRGLAGLEAWAGTPGTVGGGIYGNAHWGGRLLSECVASVRTWAPRRGVADVPVDDMEFGYDVSRLHHTREVVISAVFLVRPGNPAQLRETARRSLAYRKRTQPLALPSAGCIFQNPAAGEPVPDGIPRSAGALVDRAGLKGARVGGAVVSPIHANFIVNDGGATAADIRTLVERCRREVHERFGVDLRDEIVCLGEFRGGSEESSVHTAD